MKYAREPKVDKVSSPGSDAANLPEHNACTALLTNQAPPACPVPTPHHAQPLPGPVQFLAVDSRIERQATSRHPPQGIQQRLARHRQETIVRIEKEYGLNFGQPRSLVYGRLTRGYVLVFPNSSSGEITVSAPGQITVYPFHPHRPFILGLSSECYPKQNVIKFSASYPPDPHTMNESYSLDVYCSPSLSPPQRKDLK